MLVDRDDSFVQKVLFFKLFTTDVSVDIRKGRNDTISYTLCASATFVLIYYLYSYLPYGL